MSKKRRAKIPPFRVLNSENIFRKFVSKIMRSCDKNFAQLQAEYYQKNASGYLLWKKDKNFWISYDGIVTLGIDSSKLDVKVDGENVKIHIPEAKVLSSKPNPDSITKDSYYYAKNSAIADADDQTKAYKKAEKEMEKTAANDIVLLAQAQQRVQSMLEDYVKNMGTMLGKEYTITWDIKENHVKSDTAESTE